MIENTRKIQLNNKSAVNNGEYVIYWMQASQRVVYNHALEYAIQEANSLHKPLIVYFGLMENYPEANERHFTFMLEGLQEVKSQLSKRGINFVLRKTSPELGLIKLANEAASVVVDRGYLRIEKKWRRTLMGKIDCSLTQIESNVIVPVEEVTDKEEYAAATIRSKIAKKLDVYLNPLKEQKLQTPSIDYTLDSLEINDIERFISQLTIDHSVKKSNYYKGGLSESMKNLELFKNEKLFDYDKARNNPVFDNTSNLSPYLHYGQISPLFIALEIQKTTNKEAKEAFLEQLIIRRELAMNFVFYNNDYDNYQSILPNWAKTTLEEHTKDSREYLYTIEEFEKAKTHDPYWNAAQKEMVLTGKMHNYMRMYWGKKILEWSKTPEEAYKIAIYLNNKYELDGRDPNGYTGVAWIFGKHDRPWKERPIFGKVRYMNSNGLKRKFNADGYVKKIDDFTKV